MTQLRDAVQSLIDDVSHATDSTPEARDARDQLSRVADSIREAAQKAGDDVRPELLELLRRANAELRRVTKLDE
jgi:hypothetical protein